MKIRTADIRDAAALLAIYAHYINTSVTFEYDPPPVDEFARRIADTLTRYPYLVAEEENEIIGYAYAHALNARAAYQWSAELSIYFKPEKTHCGAGAMLYGKLVELLQNQGVRTLYACVTSPNPASENFWAKNQFAKVGVFPRAGFKCGKWHDVLWFAKAIGNSDAPESPLIPFPELTGKI